MSEFVAEQGITYPVAIDRDGSTVAAFAVDSFPDYYIVDRSGKLRFADLANAELERAIEALLAEPAPTKAPPAKAPVDFAKLDAEKVLAEALATATQQNKRVLIHFGGPG